MASELAMKVLEKIFGESDELTVASNQNKLDYTKSDNTVHGVNRVNFDNLFDNDKEDKSKSNFVDKSNFSNNKMSLEELSKL